MLNPFRILGDLAHLASILILLHKMHTSRTCAGISLKSQCLYLLVYVTRYLDLFTTFTFSSYNTGMKIIFIAATVYTIYLMRTDFKPTNDPAIDTFKVQYLVGGAFVMALIFPYQYTFMEVSWAFSLWLECVAILPQLFMIQRTGEAETITTHYIFALGIYRTLYIPNWIWRYVGSGHVDQLATIAGIIQTIVYSDFFYIYWSKVMKGKKFELPV